MAGLVVLRQRCCQAEIMDQPDLAADRHVQALQGLERINRWSGSSRILWPPIRALALQLGTKSLRMLDLASGAGDVPIALWHGARRAGISLTVDGCDRSPRAVAYAQSKAQVQDAAVKFFPWDALSETLPTGYDVIASSLFLHHLGADEAVALLRGMAGAARHMVLINDLRRSLTGLTLAYIGTRLLSTSEIVHIDGPRSVKAAFTISEVQQLAQRAGLADAVVQKRWPCRFLLTWRRP